MTCGPGGTGAVVFDLYVHSNVRLLVSAFPGAKVGMDNSDDLGGIGIITEEEEGAEEGWGVKYRIGYGVVYGGVPITGYVGLGELEKGGFKMKPIPEHVETVKRRAIRTMMKITGEGTDIAKDFSRGMIKEDTADSASCAYMANNRHRWPNKVEVLIDKEEVDDLEDLLDEFKASELNQYSKLAVGSIGPEVTIRMPGAAFCYPYRFVVVVGGTGQNTVRTSAHSPIGSLDKVMKNVKGKDWFFYKKAFLAGDFRVEAG